MKMRNLTLFLLLFLCVSISVLFAQEVSEKQEVSIFNISYYGWRFPEEIIGSLDSKIRSVIVNMGRFKVLEVRKRFEKTDDLFAFIDRVRKIKEQDMEIPEEVSYGHIIFTEADFNALISSFIVILPEVTYLNIEARYNDDNDLIGYSAQINTSYSILDAQTMEVVAKPEIESTGTGDNKRATWQDAIDSLPMDLEFELKKVPIFTLKTGVLEVHGGKIVLEKGKNMGIKTGFEFEIIRTDTIASGFSKEKHAGLVLVQSVYEEISEATILYGGPQEGDQLVEVPRMGVDGILYTQILYNTTTETTAILPGLQVIPSISFYFIKPVVGIELAIADLTDYGSWGYGILMYFGMPMNIYLGASANLYLGRLQISPTLVGGAGLIIPWDTDEHEPALSHLGYKAYLSLNYLVHRDVKITADVGYSQWFPIIPFYKLYGGILGGLAIVWKS